MAGSFDECSALSIAGGGLESSEHCDQSSADADRGSSSAAQAAGETASCGPEHDDSKANISCCSKENGSSKRIKLDEFSLTKEGQEMVKGSENLEAEGGEEESSGSSSGVDIMAKTVKQIGKTRQVAIRGKKRLRRALGYMAEVAPRVKGTWERLPSYLELALIGKEALHQRCTSYQVI